MPVEHISAPPDSNNSKRGLQGRGFGGFEGGGGYAPLPEWSQMEAMVILPISCFHHMAVDRISGPPESNNSKRGLQGHGFGGFEGGGGYPRLSEWSQMEAMVILPISYLHDIAVKCLVFLSYTPSNSSALCAMCINSFLRRRFKSIPTCDGFDTHVDYHTLISKVENLSISRVVVPHVFKL